MAKTGVPSLDRLLGGDGYPDRSTVLVEGVAGAQKERLSYRFIEAGLSSGEFCLYVTRLSARDASLEGAANGLEGGRTPVWIASEGGAAKFSIDDLVGLSVNIKVLLDKNAGRKMRIVLDFLSPMLIQDQPETVYSFLDQLIVDVKQRDAVLLGAIDVEAHKPEVIATIEDLFDGVISLTLPTEGRRRRVPALFVKKMRGVRGSVGVSMSLTDWGEADRPRIAVLPMASYSPDPSDDYFADAITEELISSLSGIRGLSVISRTSAMKFKDAKKTASEIGRELDIGLLLEGSVRKSGDKVRISVQLIDAEDDRNLWASTYDRGIQDMPAVQADIVEKIAANLHMGPPELAGSQTARSRPKNTEAYTLTLKGKFYLNRWDKDSLLKAIKYFEDAIEKDPDYAVPYAGLARASSRLGFEDAVKPREAYRMAEQYARRALELDDSLAEAHAALGGVMVDKHDFQSALAEFKRALQLNPNLVDAHLWQASVHAFSARWDDCLGEVVEALDLDPLSVETNGGAGTWYLYARRYDQAVRYLKDALELDPENLFYLGNLGLAHVQQGLFEEGLEEIRRAAKRDSSGSNIDLGYALVKAGRPEEAKQILNRLLASATEGHAQPVAIAGLLACLGDKEDALRWLGRAYEEESGYLVTIRDDFAFESLWEEPRFQSLMRKIGL